MKKIISLLIVVSLILCIIPAQAEVGQAVTVKVDGQTVAFPDAQPFINGDDRTIVPGRFVFESMGCTVDWEGENQVITIQKGVKRIVMRIGQNWAIVNDSKTDQKIEFDTKPVLITDNGETRTYIPLRFVSETMGCTVKWDAVGKTALIYTKPLEYSGSVKLISDEEFVSKYYNNLLTTPDYFKIDTENKRLIFYNNHPVYIRTNFPDYTLKENINPDINIQAYALAKNLVEEKTYISISYHKEEIYNGPSSVAFSYGDSYSDNFKGNGTFKIALFDNMYGSNKEFGQEYSDKILGYIILDEGFNTAKRGQISWDTIDYKKSVKFLDSLKIIFGEELAVELYNRIISEYIEAMNDPTSSFENLRTKIVKVKNVQLDIVNIGKPMFYFSYVE